MVGSGDGTFRDCPDHLALTRRNEPSPEHYCRSSPAGLPASALEPASLARMTDGSTSAVPSRCSIIPRTTPAPSGCSLAQSICQRACRQVDIVRVFGVSKDSCRPERRQVLARAACRAQHPPRVGASRAAVLDAGRHGAANSPFAAGWTPRGARRAPGPRRSAPFAKRVGRDHCPGPAGARPGAGPVGPWCRTEHVRLYHGSQTALPNRYV